MVLKVTFKYFCRTNLFTRGNISKRELNYKKGNTAFLYNLGPPRVTLKLLTLEQS